MAERKVTKNTKMTRFNCDEMESELIFKSQLDICQSRTKQLSSLARRIKEAHT